LGFLFENGQGVAKVDPEAVRWYSLASAQGLAAGQYNLGTCLFMVEVLHTMMRRLGDGAAFQQHRGVQLVSTAWVSCLSTVEVAKDTTEAIRLYRLAAAQGQANASAALSRLGA
jgi:hypothetical protein